MKNYYTLIFGILLFSVCNKSFAQAVMPDTTGGTAGWRYATEADANYWANVSVNDVILFGKADTYTNYPGHASIVIRSIYTNYTRMPIAGGKKIHIWRGNYGHIEILAKADVAGVRGFVEQNSSETNPVIITNLGGQVQYGNYGRYGHEGQGVHEGTFTVNGFKHVFVTGEYDPVLKTGDAQYLGMDGDMTQHGWINRFGIFGDQKYTSFAHGTGHGLGFEASSFLSIKVRGVAVLHGYFAGFSIKSDNVSMGTRTKIDIQKCLSGWHDGEGFYLGSTNGNADNVPDNLIICKNNVALFTGYEGIQADKLAGGSEIKNNFIYKTACFYQIPFQGAHFQENAFQWTFVEGNVRAENNIFYSGNAGSILNGFGIAPKTGITITPSEIVLANNLLGPSLRNFGYIQKSADPQGLVKFYITRNVIDTVTIPEANDAYVEPFEASAFMDITNEHSPFYVTHNIYPEGRSLYVRKNSGIVSAAGSKQQKAPRLLLHDQFGFDPKEILRFRGVWLTGQYNAEVTNSGPITYRKGDIVYMLEEYKTRYYRCLQDHSVVKKPSVETAFWQKMTWNGKDEPTYTPLLKADSYYNYKGMGLTYNPANTMAADTVPPVITAQQQYYYRVGETFRLPSFTASDNRDGNVTSSVKYYWKNGNTVQVNSSNRLITHGQYELILNAEDEAGNRAESFSIKILVSDQSVVLKNKSQLNIHTFSRANLTTPGSYWTDIAEDNAGLKSASSTTPLAITYSILKDTAGAVLPWTVKIPDSNNSDYYSHHFGTYDNNEAAYAIENFPMKVIEEGLMLRQGIEEECHIIFQGLDPEKYYDFRFTGLRTGAGEINIGVADSVSGQQVVFNLINNTKTYELTNLKPTSGGTISIVNTFVSSIGQTGSVQSALAGFIITEKEGFGIIGTSVQPSDATTAQIHFTYGTAVVNDPGDFWNSFKLTNSFKTHTLTSVKAKDGTTTIPVTLSVVRNGTEGFNYNNGTGLTTGDNSGIVPDIILEYFAGLNAQSANIQITGLDPSKVYMIETLSNGRSVWEGNNMFVGVTVQGVKQTQNFTPIGGNTENLLVWNNVSPDGTGKILVSVNPEAQAYGALNALILSEERGAATARMAANDEASISMKAETTEVMLSPVPAKGVINVRSNTDTNITSIRILDAAGRLHMPTVISKSSQEWSYDTTMLHGFYIMIIGTGDGKITYKNFMVE